MPEHSSLTDTGIEIATVAGVPAANGRILAVNPASGNTGRSIQVSISGAYEVVGFVPQAYAGDPNGVVAARCPRDICFDIADATKPVSYVCLTKGSTVWQKTGGAGGTTGTFTFQLPGLGETGFAIFGLYPSGWAQIPGAFYQEMIDYAETDTAIDISVPLAESGVQQFICCTFAEGSSGNSYNPSGATIVSQSPENYLSVVPLGTNISVDDQNGDVADFFQAFEIRRSLGSFTVAP